LDDNQASRRTLARRSLSPGESSRPVALSRRAWAPSNSGVSLATRGAPAFRAEQVRRRHGLDARAHMDAVARRVGAPGLLVLLTGSHASDVAGRFRIDE